MQVASSLENDHFVVIATIYDSNWKASVDGISTPIYRTNYLYQGIIVPRGNHKIVLQFKR